MPTGGTPSAPFFNTMSSFTEETIINAKALHGTITQASAEYRRLGLHPVPLHEHNYYDPDQAGKAPSINKWQEGDEPRPQIFFKQSGNIGLRLGKQPNGHILVGLDFDVDDEANEDAHKICDEWLSNHPFFDACPKIKSGRGFKLFMFIDDLPELTNVKATGNQSAGHTGHPHLKIETYYGWGAQFMVPPSIHPKTKQRNEWIKEGRIPEFSWNDLKKECIWLDKPERQKSIGSIKPTDLEKKFFELTKHIKWIAHPRKDEWHSFDCPFSNEHGDGGEQKGGLGIKFNDDGTISIHCFHSGKSGHCDLKTRDWLQRLGIEDIYDEVNRDTAKEVYGEFPSKDAVKNEVVKDTIWWVEKGPHGRSDCWTMIEGDLLSVVGQRARDHKQDCSRALSKLFNLFPRLVKEQARQRDVKDGKTTDKQTPPDADAARSIKQCWQWLDDIVRKENWVKEIRKSICGLKTGRQFHNGVPYLVQSSSHFIKAKRGSCRWTLDFLRAKLIEADGENAVQYWTFLHHLRRQVIRFTTGDFKMLCHAGFIIGNPSIGKSLCLNHIILPLLGGRAAEVWNEVSNVNNNFNSQMSAVEVLICDDTIRAVSLTGRQKFESILKSLVGTGTIQLERKGHDCITLHDHPASFWGLLNDDESVGGLPTISGGSENKWSIYYFTKAKIEPVKGGYEAQLAKERPAFLHWLIEGDMIEDCRSQLQSDNIRYSDLFDDGSENQHEDIKRFGMKTFHHTSGREQFTKTEPATHLLHFIDNIGVSRDEWTGTAGEFVNYISELIELSKADQIELSKICGGKVKSRIGYLLRALAKSHPSRVQSIERTHKGTTWRVNFTQGA